MCAHGTVRRGLTFSCFFFLAFALGATRLAAHAILESSTPASDSIMRSPDFPITLNFNVRVDASRSQLRLLFPDASLIGLSAEQSSPNTLTTKISGLKSGSYTILWQVLAPDGHITRGEIPFKVAIR